MSRSETQEQKDISSSKYRPKSKTFPPLNISPNVNAFTTQVTNELKEIHQSHNRNNNLTPNLRKALKSLEENQDLIIKPEDKGGNTVSMGRLQYQMMCQKILNNTEWYEKSNLQTRLKANRELTVMILEAEHNGTIDENTKNYLVNRNPKIPVFYALPKLHKNVSPPPSAR